MHLILLKDNVSIKYTNYGFNERLLNSLYKGSKVKNTLQSTTKPGYKKNEIYQHAKTYIQNAVYHLYTCIYIVLYVNKFYNIH